MQELCLTEWNNVGCCMKIKVDGSVRLRIFLKGSQRQETLAPHDSNAISVKKEATDDDIIFRPHNVESRRPACQLQPYMSGPTHLA